MQKLLQLFKYIFISIYIVYKWLYNIGSALNFQDHLTSGTYDIKANK